MHRVVVALLFSSLLCTAAACTEPDEDQDTGVGDDAAIDQDGDSRAPEGDAAWSGDGGDASAAGDADKVGGDAGDRDAELVLDGSADASADAAATMDGSTSMDGSTGDLDASQLDASLGDSATGDAVVVSDAAQEAAQPDAAVTPDGSQADAAAGPDATTDASPPLLERCGFQPDPSRPDRIFSPGFVGDAAWVGPGTSLVAAVRSTATSNTDLSAWILWSQSGLKQIASGNGLVLDVKADRFLVAARDYYYELRSLVDGALITTVLRPLSEISVAAARAGLAVDGSYLWIRTDRYLDAFEADGTRWLHIADNFGLSQILATPEAVYAGRGPLAPEVQRFPRTGVPTVTSGVLGTFDTWLLDGKWFVTVSPGNLTRVYATDGTPVSGLLTNCRTPFAASGNLFWCVSSLVSGLQQFDLSIGPTPTPTIVPLSGDTSALKLGQNGLLLANQRIDLTPSGASVTTVPVPGPGTLLAAKGDVWLGSGFLNDAYLRSGFLGNLASIRPFGCGAVNGLASSETGLLAISTQLGLLGYDTLTRTFRWSIEGTSLSTGLYYSLPGGSPTLSNDGSKLFFNGKLYALGPQPTLLADVAAFNGSIVNPTLEFVGGKKAGDPATWQVRRLPSGEIVQETSANPNYAPDVPVVNHSGRSVAVTAPGAVWLYRDAALTGSYANVKPGVWLSESLLYAEGLILNQQGVKQPAPVCGQDVGAVGVSFAGGLQVLPGTQFYQHGQVCDYGSTSPTPPAVSLFQNTMPAWLIGDLGAYVVGPRQEIWLKPWH